MRKLSKDILERAIKTGMKSEGYSGSRVDRRAIEALRGAKLGKLLGKKSVDQKQVYASLEALKKKGLISERQDLKRLVKKSISEERRQEQKENFEQKISEADKQRIQERTARGYIRERREEETTEDRRKDVRAHLASITEVREEKGKFTAIKPVHTSISEIVKESKEEKGEEAPPSEAKDLPI